MEDRAKTVARSRQSCCHRCVPKFWLQPLLTKAATVPGAHGCFNHAEIGQEAVAYDMRRKRTLFSERRQPTLPAAVTHTACKDHQKGFSQKPLVFRDYTSSEQISASRPVKSTRSAGSWLGRTGKRSSRSACVTPGGRRRITFPWPVAEVAPVATPALTTQRRHPLGHSWCGCRENCLMAPWQACPKNKRDFF